MLFKSFLLTSIISAMISIRSLHKSFVYCPLSHPLACLSMFDLLLNGCWHLGHITFSCTPTRSIEHPSYTSACFEENLTHPSIFYFITKCACGMLEVMNAFAACLKVCISYVNLNFFAFLFLRGHEKY